MSLDPWVSISQMILDASVYAFGINICHFIYSFKVKLEKSNNAVIDVLLTCIQFYDSPLFHY